MTHTTAPTSLTSPTPPAPDDLELFLVTLPGLEEALRDEARALGFRDAAAVPGGVTVRGGWPEVWRANVMLRGASRVLVRIGAFRAFHLAQLDKRARRVDWGAILRPDVPVRVEASCKGSRIYHDRAAAQRIARAIEAGAGAPIGAEAEVVVKARIQGDVCTLSLDTSGEGLHKRGHKEAVGKAPLRETLAALFLRQCGYDGRETVVDSMCGSGTFVIEAAEIAAGLAPGRSRRFAFQHLATFDPAAFAAITVASADADGPAAPRAYGYDRDAGAITMSGENAARAGVEAWTAFAQQTVSDLEPPPGPPGLVIVNPPYGLRIGEKTALKPLYQALGRTLLERFTGWRVGLVTSEAPLARATGLPFGPAGPPVPHGGVRIRLYATGPL
ncbi:class I SAM-dependent RNA methyltransferase [Roseospira marina]|uniref:Class I SAM-dependent RNA methyltransferase n=1 Tax=Roseospira marina TaxID=140057 RepID=A0A5M6IBJ0_9PROT|nr:class I SAM-dependent RNA methyltransferase [Roseospira marina]KAA5605482.1 class I SAM-dependent RNA methyltransferase [Roseospira marina]MBB4314515.1 putative N6-adenine-specific DNA methylase [Roseospira marina]MBB5088657.1 putative N6-adenine-specific DNA methylase [Roseospira marina]